MVTYMYNPISQEAVGSKTELRLPGLHSETLCKSRSKAPPRKPPPWCTGRVSDAVAENQFRPSQYRSK